MKERYTDDVFGFAIGIGLAVAAFIAIRLGCGRVPKCSGASGYIRREIRAKHGRQKAQIEILTLRLGRLVLSISIVQSRVSKVVER